MIVFVYFYILLRFLIFLIKEKLKNYFNSFLCAKSHKTILKTYLKEKQLKGRGINVIVLDLKTNKFNKYVSIAEAARALNTHTKTIWRKIQDNKLYLDRYQIIKYTEDIDYKYKHIKLYSLHTIYYNIIPKDYKYVFKVIKNSSILIPYILLIIFICIMLYVVIMVCIDLYNIYVYNLNEFRANHLKYILEHRFTSNNISSNSKLPVIIDKMSKFSVDSPWCFERSAEWQFKYTHFYSNLSDVLKINSPILSSSNVNLDFSSMVSNSVCFGEATARNNIVDNSLITSSPIISQANFNGINSVVSINPVVNFEPIYRDYTNSLGIYSNRDSLTLATNDLALVKTKELLNYQSNILYCLINGLSPSLY